MNSWKAIGPLATLFLALCGDASAAQGTPKDISVFKRPDGTGFADNKGMALYFNDLTRQSPAACAGECATRWKPLIASADAEAAGDWALVAGPDGSKQWSYRGNPLFTSILDHTPGVANGDNDLLNQGTAGGSWRTAYEPMTVPPEITVAPAYDVRVLADKNGMTLYTYDRDMKPGSSACDNACAFEWPPLTAPMQARDVGDWSLVVRSDKTKQWAYKGKPLYRSKLDSMPGEKNGDGLSEMWRAAVVHPARKRPTQVGIRATEMGPALTDEAGKTLYAYYDSDERLKRKCNDDCMKANWRAVVAPRDAQPLEAWTVITRQDGSKQWAFQGRPLYTFVLDNRPGDLNGELFGYGGNLQEGVWKAVMLEPAS